jgi:hypothetical protein
MTMDPKLKTFIVPFKRNLACTICTCEEFSSKEQSGKLFLSEELTGEDKISSRQNIIKKSGEEWSG